MTQGGTIEASPQSPRMQAIEKMAEVVRISDKRILELQLQLADANVAVANAALRLHLQLSRDDS